MLANTGARYPLIIRRFDLEIDRRRNAPPLPPPPPPASSHSRIPFGSQSDVATSPRFVVARGFQRVERFERGGQSGRQRWNGVKAELSCVSLDEGNISGALEGRGDVLGWGDGQRRFYLGLSPF